MKLSDFIRASMEPILDDWEKFAGAMVVAKGMDAAALRDHARGILESITHDMDLAQSPEQQRAKSRGESPHGPAPTQAEEHGYARVTEGFSINEAMAEYRALRASVLRLWAEQNKETPACAELTRFNEAVDQALTESLARFSDVRNRQTRLFDALLSTSPDLNYIFDLNGRLVYANKAFGKAFNKTPSELVGASLFALLAPFSQDIRERVRLIKDSLETWCGEVTVIQPDGKPVTFENLLVPVISPEGKCEAVAGSARDITERKASEERARRSANHDYLTDLPNRSLFRERLGHEMRHSGRTGLPLALLFVDLDGFKGVNDQFGHLAGDQLLQQVAARISGCVRDTDTVARLGGDEFTIVLTDVTMPDHVDSVARKILEALDRPFDLRTGSVSISGSIGIALYPADAKRMEELIRKADTAMYAAKNAGRNRYSFFTDLAPPP